jgi:3-hydroxyisobutyrate dehydrogenase-like beta-hydroxyacid dehydrogenase
LASAAEQLYLSASSQGFGRQDDSGVVRVYTPSTPTIVHEQAKPIANQSETLAPSVSPLDISKIGFVGLGAMGIGMATSLVNKGFNVCGYDVYEPSKQKFIAVGERASGAKSPAEAARGAAIFILMVQNAAQVTDVLFGNGKAADVLPDSSIVILNSTVPPSFIKDLRQRLISLGRKLELIDAPVSGGVARAAAGELTVS